MNDNPTMQDVLRHFYPKYLDSYTPTASQAKTVHHILNCKTGAYGANISECDTCGHIQYHNNSCRDRSCPMCQALANELWVDAQNEHVLDIDYYHLVFTCPSELNPLIYCNQKELYSLFFHAVAETIQELSEDPSHMGGTPGFISIMHTWELEDYTVLVTQEGTTFVVTNTYDEGTPENPEQPENPDQPGNPTLPQTGQLWWPVPVLVAGGLLLIVIGLLRRRGNTHEK